MRLNSDGSLDSSFDGDGLVATDFGGADIARDIVVGGYAANGSHNDFALAIYATTNGSLKISALADFGDPGQVSHDVAYSLDVSADGSIVMVGQSYTDTTSASFAIARFTRDGVLETGFGTEGKVIMPMSATIDSYAFDAVFQPNGKIDAALARKFAGLFAGLKSPD